jgi:hypothetical protein
VNGLNDKEELYHNHRERLGHRLYKLQFHEKPFSAIWWVQALEYATEEFETWDALTETEDAPQIFWDNWNHYKRLRVWILDRIRNNKKFNQ